MCEFMPLPKTGKGSIEPYNTIWNTPENYKVEVAPKRTQLIVDTLQRNRNVKCIVSYDREATAYLLYDVKYLKAGEWVILKNQRYYLYNIILKQDRNLYLLQTPFFGQGQISYAGIHAVTQEIRSIIEL